MLGMGVPPVNANATNTVALWPGQLTSAFTLFGDTRRNLLAPVATTCLVGGVLGAEVLLHTRQQTFSRLIPWLLLGGTLLFGISGPLSTWLRRRTAEPHVQKAVPFFGLFLALLPVCFYIGYFGAGGGFLIMTVLAMFGVEDMHQLNALKVVAACLCNLVAIVTFVVKGAVLWHYCLTSMVAAGLGGYLGAKWAKKTNPMVLRVIVVITGCVISGYFFWKQAHA